MTNDSSMPAERNADQRQHRKWNYFCHMLDGGLYMGGLACVAGESILPPLVQSLGGPTWLIAMLPQINMLGFLLPTLLLAHWVERQAHLKPAVLLFGIPQRLPVLASGLALLYWGTSNPLLTAFIVGLSPFISGLWFGLMMTGWTELVSRTIPAERRSSMIAARNLIGACLAMGAGWAIKIILEEFPGPKGYAYLHFMAFSLMVVSWLILTRIRETPYTRESDEEGSTFWSNLTSAPALLKTDRHFKHYVLSRVFGSGMWIGMPFVTIHILDITGRPLSFLGLLVTVQMAGNFFGNLVGGYIGDTRGGRLVLLTSRTCFISSYALIALVSQPVWFLVAFFLLGAGLTQNMIGHSTLMLELPPESKRPTYVGLASFMNAPPLVLSGLLSWQLKDYFSTIAPLLWISVGFICISFYHIYRICEPRQRGLLRNT